MARAIGYGQVSVSHEVSPLMKLVSRGDTTVVDAYLSPILRRYVGQVAAELEGVRLMFMQSNGGLTDARRFQGKDAILSGPAGGIVGAVRTSLLAGLRQDHRLRHGRHLDRRVALRRRIRARLRNPGRGRAHARADDEHPHGGRGRRLDPAFRRRALSRRTGFGRGQSRTRFLSQARAAGGHRLQRHAGQDPAEVLPVGVRAGRGRAARRRSGAAEIRRAGARNPRSHRRCAHAGAGGRGLHRHRRGQHGQCDQADFGAARPRRDRIHAVLLRRRRRPARLPGGRCAGHDAGIHPPARRRAVGLRHGPRRHHRDARAGGGGARSRRTTGSCSKTA